MSNNITVEMVQEELTSISELYNSNSSIYQFYYPTLAHDIHSNIRHIDVIEDLRDVVHYELGSFEDNFSVNSSEANFWMQRGYAPSVARKIAYGISLPKNLRFYPDDMYVGNDMYPSGHFNPQEYRGALRVGDTVGYKEMEEVSELWTVDRYRLLDETDNQPHVQVLFLERRKKNGSIERKLENYFLSPDATNEVIPF